MKLRLVSNAWANLLGAAIPALVMLGTVPLVVKGLGEANYGVYSLVTAIVGYFAVIDINVTAGSVKYIAEHNARRDDAKIAETFSFGLATYLIIGLLGACGLFLGAHWFVTEVFSVPARLIGEATATLELAALGFLLGQLQNYLNSVPQSLMRYDLSSRVEMAFGTLVPLATVGILMLGYGLFEVILLRVLASGLHCLFLWRAIRSLLPGLAWRWPGARIRGELLGFSAYSFLARFASLSYAYADKLIIGALVGVTGLAYFTVAATLANRVLGLTFRLSGVFFPAASALAARGELARLDQVYVKATRYVVYLNAAILVLVAVFAHQILGYWMNEDFARHGAVVLAVMALSQFVDSLTNLPSLVNDGMGHPRVSGMFALGRALAGLLVVWLGVAGWGIDGAAWGHLLGSMLFTTAFVLYVHGRTVPTSLARLLSQGYAPGLAGVALVAIAATAAEQLFDAGPLDFIVILCATVMLLGAHGFLFVIERDDRLLAWSRTKEKIRARWQPAGG
ncbi:MULTISPECIES: oligosaccharide flippase family protein [unclassified Massilia]|uniref:oligosaccharide flippase family protein n=1 Tax=unclassified Massilia TaxID=2609279 RepID=UPI001B819BDE|nr:MULTISPECIES: oligosaccharide flippase family protein [unclassified Massilia]MBQ5938592.1 oligosaccharide flippase family protein [Massilia sp. AB1]MBQ5964582.1 oligosaccharide flippase family protein [Massilia sp. ZL223]